MVWALWALLVEQRAAPRVMAVASCPGLTAERAVVRKPRSSGLCAEHGSASTFGPKTSLAAASLSKGDGGRLKCRLGWSYLVRAPCERRNDHAS